ncbi:nitrogen regulatory protein P-II homolog isoform X1 [Actinidia eriantha]|uniref:nitrogen regulatory protein P-II homolog isoform X1 n=1 Tax=Actinidia eriantha TaxID=165200 RepID=UPI002582D0FD|nr:nitrogen regulatory protein P-II homolog isoform X1 [Actinidia eriantha]
MASSMVKAGALAPLSSQLKEFPLLAPTSIPFPTHKLRHSPFSPTIPNLSLKRTPVPTIRAQTSTDYIPDAKFYKVEAILRPWRIPQVSSALLKMGIRGVTISDVRGFGAQGGLTERQAGSEFSEDKLVAKVKMEIVVSKDQVEYVIDKIIEEARTGEIGDGKFSWCPSQM